LGQTGHRLVVGGFDAVAAVEVVDLEPRWAVTGSGSRICL
jgi:hypothetical protein